MKIKSLLLFAAAASLSVSAFADDLSTGELAWLPNGDPAMTGQATQDHFFVRGDYDDMGDMQTYDNTLSFKSGAVQTIWFYLNDDEIYQNEAVQALTPIAYNPAGDLYNEITYNSFQLDVFIPQGLELTYNDDYEQYAQGDRLPSSSTLTVGQKDEIKVIDGKNYNAYTVVVYNSSAFGSHLSAKTPGMYRANGALKKDHTVFGLFIKNNNQDAIEGQIDDIVLGNMILNLRETAIAEWSSNESTFFYGTGGNAETQRFMQYNRVSTFGSANVVENLAQKTINNVKYYNIAGMENNEPFDGVNIKVVTYNDGTTSTCKVIK